MQKGSSTRESQENEPNTGQFAMTTGTGQLIECGKLAIRWASDRSSFCFLISARFVFTSSDSNARTVAKAPTAAASAISAQRGEVDGSMLFTDCTAKK